MAVYRYPLLPFYFAARNAAQHPIRVHSPDALSNTPELDNFSLIRGGLIHDLRVRLKLSAKDPAIIRREVATVFVITWIPLLILSIVEGHAFGTGVKIPLEWDYSTNIRFLFALPLLILAEATIDPHIREAVRHFVISGLVTEKQLQSFEDVIRSTLRLRDSWIANIVLILMAFGPSFWNGGEMVGTAETSSWHYVNSAGGPHIGLAGLWFAFVSIPFYRVIMFRWGWLLVVWAVFLWRVTQLRLNCVATHPDRSGGLGFLAHTEMFFGMVSFAASSALAGAFANMLVYQGSTIFELKFLMIGAAILTLAFTTAPLLMVSSGLFRVKQRGIFEYSSLGVEYAEGFDDKWIRGKRETEDELLGSADIQSLADLGNSYEIIHEMKIVPIDHKVLLQLAIPAALPMLILAATATPAEEVLKALVDLL